MARPRVLSLFGTTALLSLGAAAVIVGAPAANAATTADPSQCEMYLTYGQSYIRYTASSIQGEDPAGAQTFYQWNIPDTAVPFFNNTASQPFGSIVSGPVAAANADIDLADQAIAAGDVPTTVADLNAAAADLTPAIDGVKAIEG